MWKSLDIQIKQETTAVRKLCNITELWKMTGRMNSFFQHKSGSQRSVDRFASKEFFLHACHPFLQLHLREVTTRLASCVSLPVKLSEEKPRWVVTHVGFYGTLEYQFIVCIQTSNSAFLYKQLVVVSYRWKWPDQGSLRWVVINKPKDSSMRQNFAPGQFGHHDWENLSLADKLPIQPNRQQSIND